MVDTRKHITIPHTVGIINDNAVHLKLFVSLCIVQQVVPHGKCIRENSIVHIAVTQVHPLFTSNMCNWSVLLMSIMLPVDKYAIIIIGITISFAGKPKMNPINIVPSRPMSFAKGSKKFAQ